MQIIRKRPLVYLALFCAAAIAANRLYSQVDLSSCGTLGQTPAAFAGTSLSSPSLWSIDETFRCMLRTFKAGEPAAPKAISLSDFPSYQDLEARLENRMRAHKIFVLRQSLTVAQRVSPAYVMAEGFYSQANALRFCDNGICQYDGNVFVTLKSASLSPSVPPGTWLQYVGLVRYTTVLGAPETLPRFRVVTDQDFSDVQEAADAVQRYHPTQKEVEEASKVQFGSYRVKDAAWLRAAMGEEETFLRERGDAVGHLPVEEPQGQGGHLSRFQQESAPKFLAAYQTATATMLQSLARASLGEQSPVEGQLQASRAAYDQATSRIHDALLNCALDSASQGIISAQWLNVGCWASRLTGSSVASRAYLGVYLANGPVAFGGNFVAGPLSGALVAKVAPNSPASDAGIDAGDAIVSFNGQRVTSPSDLTTLIAWTSPGSDVVIGLVVPEVTAQRTAQLSELGATECGEALTFEFRKPRTKPAGFVMAKAPTERFTYAQSSPRCSSKLGWIVQGVEPGSPAAQAGIRTGDIVEEAKGTGFSSDVTVRVLRPLQGDYNLDHYFSIKVHLASRPQ